MTERDAVIPNGRASIDVKAEQITNDVKAKATIATAAIGDVADHALDAAQSVESSLRDLIEKRPITVVLAVLGVGWVIGRLGRL